MSKPNFTPGPWSIVEDEVNALTHPAAIVGPFGRPVIQANSDYDRSPQRRGDALFLDCSGEDIRLAAAAPQLYEALKAVEWLSEPGFWESCPRCGKGYSQAVQQSQREHHPNCQLAAALNAAEGE